MRGPLSLLNVSTNNCGSINWIQHTLKQFYTQNGIDTIHHPDFLQFNCGLFETDFENNLILTPKKRERKKKTLPTLCRQTSFQCLSFPHSGTQKVWAAASPPAESNIRRWHPYLQTQKRRVRERPRGWWSKRKKKKMRKSDRRGKKTRDKDREEVIEGEQKGKKVREAAEQWSF